jgi:hypothetical protein
LNDNKEFRKIQNHLRKNLAKHKGEVPEGLMMIASEDMKSLCSQVGHAMRRLMSRALQTAILYKDFTSTEKLL